MEADSTATEPPNQHFPSQASGMSACDTVGIAVRASKDRSTDLNGESPPADSPGVGSEKEEVVSMLGESREVSEEFRDSVSTLTANSHSTSMSSLTLSSSDYAKAFLPIPTRNTRFLAHQNSMILPKNSPRNSAKMTHSQSASSLITGSPHAAPITTVSKTLSFRTDSASSLGSLGSLQSNVDIPLGTPPKADLEESDSIRNSFDTDTGLPRRFNNHNISSILISALKSQKRPSKKSVSFSIPSDDDIARRARKSPGSLLYHTPVQDFDDSIPDYQVVSPKNAGGKGPKARLFTSPTKSTAEEKEGEKKASKRTARSTSLPAAVSSPPAPKPSTGAIKSNGVKTAPNSQLPPRPPMPAPINTNLQGLPDGANHSPKNAAAPVFHTALGSASSGVNSASSSLPLMQRVGQASSTAELCEVFGITTDTVFLGETMKKRFSKDLIGKDRMVWIVPRTKSIHWAKNVRDKRESFKVKYFLLDKNSPYVKLAGAGGVDLSGSSASSGDNRAGTSSNGGSDNSIEAIPVLTADSAAASSTNSTNRLSAGNAATTTPNATNTANNTTNSAGNTTSKLPSPLHRTYSADRASGELVGIIHSATISHLSIRIQTEAGEYLNLTLGGGVNAAQRAKDWFAVIKALTRDLGAAPVDAGAVM